MELYLIRHAVAVDGDAALSDEARPLTAEGRAQFALVARGLERLGVRFDRLLHSPLLRAVETAELLMSLAEESEVCELLTHAPSKELLAEFRGQCTAAVGHEPWLSELAAWLATGSREMAPAFALKKGGVVVLEGEPRPGAMRLEAFLPPKILRKFGE